MICILKKLIIQKDSHAPENIEIELISNTDEKIVSYLNDNLNKIINHETSSIVCGTGETINVSETFEYFANSLSASKTIPEIYDETMSLYNLIFADVYLNLIRYCACLIKMHYIIKEQLTPNSTKIKLKCINLNTNKQEKIDESFLIEFEKIVEIANVIIKGLTDKLIYEFSSQINNGYDIDVKENTYLINGIMYLPEFLNENLKIEHILPCKIPMLKKYNFNNIPKLYLQIIDFNSIKEIKDKTEINAYEVCGKIEIDRRKKQKQLCKLQKLRNFKMYNNFKMY